MPTPTTLSKPLKRRYSYSFANASRFLPIYDRLLDIYNDPSQYTAPSITLTKAHFPGIASQTLINRISDGLKWLVEKFDIPDELPAELRPRYKRESYAHLKLNLRLSHNGESVTLSLRLLKTISHAKTFRESIDKIPVQDCGPDALSPNLTPPGKDEVSTFRYDVETFLADTQQTVIMFKDLHPTESDATWIKNILLTTPGLVHNWSGATLTIVKEK